MTIKPTPIQTPDINDKVAFLKRPESYPEPTDRVDTAETHTSWLFFTERYVYKLKKPLRYDFLDFSTVAARWQNCEAEVRLNRRLARNVYLGILPLTRLADGRLHLGGDGPPGDWLVKMHRLAGDRELEGQIKNGTVRDDDLVRLGEVLTEFYDRESPVDMDMFLYLERFKNDMNDNRRELTLPEFGLENDWVETIVAAQMRFLEENAALLTERVRQRRIVEAHGDLRPEHIYLGPEPVIIDCLEFNREFRILDPADEIAFLAMECERLDAAFVGKRVLTVYKETSSDKPPEELVDFYMSYRALLWAKLAIRHLRRHPEERKKWVERTNTYLRLAERHIRKAC